MKYAVIGSGSKANSYIFSHDKFSCLIDNGYSFVELQNRLSRINIDIGTIKFILLTHTHADHIHGVKTTARKLKIPVFVNKEIDISAYLPSDKIDLRFIEKEKTYRFGPFYFLPFETYHDATGSLSYSLKIADMTFTVITDTGKVSNTMFNIAKKSDILFLEANYNKNMLKTGPYPKMLKERIESPYGHLSNSDAIDFLNNLFKGESKLKLVYFCHLSEVNNNPEVLEEEIISNGTFNIPYIICPRDKFQEGFNPINLEINENLDNYKKPYNYITNARSRKDVLLF
ncbi:MAG TPA: MBL fold metallo-hydrolase [Exilispira sp.]|nr:MBL fold metallo-hydrolase [Spirochaetota bacterium]NLJ05092.1 MBL fold metallo-hydrolase [Exilispira sp.]HPB47929.1 MBL fold metallo-hydrolase [Exilispira sp.]HQJ40633.1 MBL fold metallo-hydrolase [Exilispira sp.]HQQ18699.1 MBL fold metallo-hydrolase [Exilispira sp.]